jgi:hypothetical protein
MAHGQSVHVENEALASALMKESKDYNVVISRC